MCAAGQVPSVEHMNTITKLQWPLILGLGALALVFPMMQWRHRRKNAQSAAADPVRPGAGSGAGWGCVSGFTSFIAHAGGPPLLIYLLRRGLDLKARVEVPAFPAPVAVKGPWAAPRLYPDIEGILTDPAAAFARLKTMTAAGN